jgi:hypothetical protein
MELNRKKDSRGIGTKHKKKTSKKVKVGENRPWNTLHLFQWVDVSSEVLTGQSA